MSHVLDDLVSLLSLEPIEENLFRGRSQDLGFRQLFGGQVLGQSLSAASKTVEDERHVHSLHGYFLRPGDAHLPVVYQVDRVRDGGSFSTRRVTAIQKGHPIFTCSASFQYDEEGFEHQSQMPQVVGPENLPSELELMRQREHLIPAHMKDKLLCPKPIEFRPVTEPQADRTGEVRLVSRRRHTARHPGAAQIHARLRFGLQSADHLAAAPRQDGLAEGHADRQPRPLIVVPR